MAGIKLYLLKPGKVNIGETQVTNATGNCSKFSGGDGIITIADGNLASVLPQAGGEWASIRSDWLYVDVNADGIFEYMWRIKSISGDAIYVDGTVPAFTTKVYKVMSVVDPRCAWTDVTTVTHFDCECREIAEAPDNELTIQRFANRGTVIVNTKKFNGMGAISNMFLGNRNDTVDYAGRVQKALDYAFLYWPSTTPKYWIIFRYTWPTGTEYTGNYKYYSAAFGRQRVIPQKPQYAEDSLNNLTLKQLALELL